MIRTLTAEMIKQRVAEKKIKKIPLIPISDIEIGHTYNIAGRVLRIDKITEVLGWDGMVRVSNVYISDGTTHGIWVALWGEHANMVNKLKIGSEIKLIDAYARYGRNELDLNAGTMTIIQIKLAD